MNRFTELVAISETGEPFDVVFQISDSHFTPGKSFDITVGFGAAFGFCRFGEDEPYGHYKATHDSSFVYGPKRYFTIVTNEEGESVVEIPFSALRPVVAEEDISK